ncbi:polysaccharide biosynthesis tyrosine autokinase [uncultured Polaribacter sp.]|uniref:GumC family protein n=1 Tax=uncultured Polaribacter sp. TaxID=174711 RepID=UPI00261DFB83|nr:polysaccharide biosynthesis tyrosine autokinase [uncultured Polaribacter sp.]
MQIHKESNSLDINESTETINIREEIEKYIYHWKWFVLGVFVSFLLAFLYLRYSTPEYSASASILIKDNQKSGISKELEAFKDMGIVGGSSANNTDNEIEILKSRKIIGTVVDSLNLTTIYSREGRVKRSEVYGASNPVNLKLIRFNEDFLNRRKDTSFLINFSSSNTYELKDLQGVVVDKYQFNENVVSELGEFSIEKLKAFNDEQVEVLITIIRRDKIIDQFKNAVSISPVNKNASVLDLSITYPIQEKAEDFLDELVKQYNIDAIADKSEVSQKTKNFIDDRLEAIGKDLNAIQDKVKDFKTDNNITGLSGEGELALATANANNEKLIAVKTELEIAKGVYQNIRKNSNNNETLPQNLGFSDASIAESIKQFNDLVLLKNRLSVNAGSKNPQIIQYNKEIEILKINLKQSISNLIASLETQYNQINKEANKVKYKVSTIPLLERGFIDIARQQEIISGLYEYLLKKKEETAISLAVTVPNAKIIDKAYSTGIPVSPKRKIIYLAAILLGLIVPFIIIYLRNLLDTKVHNKKDIENALTVPFLGDIPRSESKEKVIVGSDARSSGSEAFRLVRTNLDFMLASKKGSKKFIFITSTTSGEGKSFISINLSATLALSGKKVLLIGMDLRAPKVTEYLGLESKKGVTNYITSDDLTLDELKFQIPQAPTLDIISSGAIPPNPAELLSGDNVKNLFQEIDTQQDYDYVVVDTAPVNLVTDTLLISKYADMFLYIVRANYLDKRLLAVPQELYKNKRLPNMSIVLNDTDPKRSYGYGYGYGGYGYGYLAEEEQGKSWFGKIFNRS